GTVARRPWPRAARARSPAPARRSAAAGARAPRLAVASRPAPARWSRPPRCRSRPQRRPARSPRPGDASGPTLPQPARRGTAVTARRRPAASAILDRTGRRVLSIGHVARGARRPSRGRARRRGQRLAALVARADPARAAPPAGPLRPDRRRLLRDRRPVLAGADRDHRPAADRRLGAAPGGPRRPPAPLQRPHRAVLGLGHPRLLVLAVLVGAARPAPGVDGGGAHARAPGGPLGHVVLAPVPGLLRRRRRLLLLRGDAARLRVLPRLRRPEPRQHEERAR